MTGIIKRLPVEQNHAGRWSEYSVDRQEEGRLTGSIAAKQSRARTLLNINIEAIQADGAIRIGIMQPA